MEQLSIALLAFVALTPLATKAAPRPIGPDEAGVIGGWSGDAPVDGLVLQPVVDVAGCLKLAVGTSIISNHVDLNRPEMGAILRVKPGRYAIAGARWREQWVDQYDMVGVSRPVGDLRIVDLAPGVVTDIGVWPVTSPYAHRFIPGDPDTNVAAAEAESLAKGVGPIAPAHWVRARVLEADAKCPAS